MSCLFKRARTHWFHGLAVCAQRQIFKVTNQHEMGKFPREFLSHESAPIEFVIKIRNKSPKHVQLFVMHFSPPERDANEKLHNFQWKHCQNNTNTGWKAKSHAPHKHMTNTFHCSNTTLRIRAAASVHRRVFFCKYISAIRCLFFIVCMAVDPYTQLDFSENKHAHKACDVYVCLRGWSGFPRSFWRFFAFSTPNANITLPICFLLVVYSHSVAWDTWEYSVRCKSRRMVAHKALFNFFQVVARTRTLA